MRRVQGWLAGSPPHRKLSMAPEGQLVASRLGVTK